MPDLRSLLPGIRFVVVGGTATSLYMPQRVTRDVDILVPSADAAKAERALVQAGAKPLGALSIDNPLRISGNSWQLPDGSELDVLKSARPWAKEALAEPRLDPAGLPIVTLPFLVLMKLASARGIDIGDISRMLGGTDEETYQRVRLIVGKYLPDAMGDLQTLPLLDEITNR